MKNKTIYIVLSMSGTKFARFLKYMKPEMAYPHVSISLDKNLRTLYSFARHYYYLPILAGFVEEHLSYGILGKMNASCEVLEVKVSESQYNDVIRMIEYIKRNSRQYSYNFSGLVYTYFNMPQKLKHKFTCTQFVAWVLDNADINVVNKPTSLIISNDYYNMPNSRLIYHGLLNDYNFKNA